MVKTIDKKYEAIAAFLSCLKFLNLKWNNSLIDKLTIKDIE